MPTPITLFQLLSARLCHDFISAFSSIQLGIEALQDHVDTESYDFLNHNLIKFSTKAKLFKAVFAHPEDLNKSLKLLEEFAALFSIKFISFIDNNHKEDLLKSQFFSLLIFIAIETLPRGGTLTIQQDSTAFQVQTEGRIILNPDLQQFMETQTVPSLNARNVLYEWALTYAHHLEHALTFTTKSGHFMIQAQQQNTALI